MLVTWLVSRFPVGASHRPPGTRPPLKPPAAAPCRRAAIKSLRRGLHFSCLRPPYHEDAGRIELSLNQAPVSVLVTQGHAYVKVTSALLKSQNLPTAACALVCGRYLKVPPSQAKSMLADVQWSSLLGRLKSMPKWSYVRTVTVNGQPAWQPRAADGSAAYVAAQGPPYPLRLMKGSNRIDFTQWNAVTIPPPPPASQVVDLSQLQR